MIPFIQPACNANDICLFPFLCRNAMESAVVSCVGLCLYHDKALYYDECFDKCNRY